MKIVTLHFDGKRHGLNAEDRSRFPWVTVTLRWPSTVVFGICQCCCWLFNTASCLYRNIGYFRITVRMTWPFDFSTRCCHKLHTASLRIFRKSLIKKGNGWSFKVLMGNLLGTRICMYVQISWLAVKWGMRYACSNFVFSAVCYSPTHKPVNLEIPPWPLGMTLYQCSQMSQILTTWFNGPP